MPLTCRLLPVILKDVQAQTPMLRQYFATKQRYPGVLLAMRVGDFYEFYGEDAEIAARALEITLTGREDGKNGRVSMSGVPYHSVDKYLARLIKQGFKVALCDQVEDPKLAKGLVKREVTRVLTPGTVLEDSMLESNSNNFLAAAAPMGETAGVSFLDLTTGEFLVTQISGEGAEEKILEEIARFSPAECLLPEDAEELFELISQIKQTMITRGKFLRPNDARHRLLKQFETQSLSPFGLEELEAATSAAGSILNYLDENAIQSTHIQQIRTYFPGDRMRMDSATIKSLELVANMTSGSRKMTLLETLDFTQTPMGARLIKRWITEPLLSIEEITQRLDSVEIMKNNAIARMELRTVLNKLYDLDRLVGRVSTGVANARDLDALRNSLSAIPELQEVLIPLRQGRCEELQKEIDPHSDLLAKLKLAIVDDPPFGLREGGIIRKGFHQELDGLRSVSKEGKEFIAKLENEEREKTGIEKLKAGYNSVFGYYLEIPKSQADKAPPHYIRKQTTTNTERYITAELKEYEAKVLGAEERAMELEYRLFNEIRLEVASYANTLLQTSRAIAELDVLQSFAESAVRYRFTKPQIEDSCTLEIQNGRHPVVEANMAIGSFVPNDVSLNESTTLIILTGPNMSGKSTYLRQNALIVLMAQIGCFVPAESARIGLADRVFARIGARDELASGQSTFMVEMVETANILHHATDKSLVILDEIGRGTSTFDGLAMAWAISERIAEMKCRCLFATHYHQLNSLAEQLSGIKNFRVAVREEGDTVIWLHKVLEGGTDRSYGIHVARMAGIPKEVVERAAEVLSDLEGKEASPQASRIKERTLQMTLFEAQESEVEKKLKELDPNTLTPVEALVVLEELKQRAAKTK